MTCHVGRSIHCIEWNLLKDFPRAARGTTAEGEAPDHWHTGIHKEQRGAGSMRRTARLLRTSKARWTPHSNVSCLICSESCTRAQFDWGQ